MAPHTGSATPEQIDTLLNFLDEHRDLARGRLRGGDGNAHAKRLWEELCNMLNSMGGSTKTVQQWQKVWFDRKHLAKKAAADTRRSASATGGGPSMSPPLSQSQLKILSIMGDGFGERQTGARVPAFSETNEPNPSTSSQTSQPLSVNLDLHKVAVDYVEPSQEDRQLVEPQPPVSRDTLTYTLSSRPTRPRRRQSAADSIRSRLYQYEEGRVGRETVRNTELAGIRTTLSRLETMLGTELTGIRAALEQLPEVLREYLDHRN